MMNAHFLGTIETTPDGGLRLVPPQITPAPLPDPYPVKVPHHVLRALDAGRAQLAPVLGDSMEPSILHNDTILIARDRAPVPGGVIVVRTDRPHPVYGPIIGCVWRYQGDAIVRKDNPRYREELRVAPHDVLGVVTHVCPRAARDPHEHHERIQHLNALSIASNAPPINDSGFYTSARQESLQRVLTFPDSELLDGRLPWGLCRATAKASHRHAGIKAGDTLTIHPTGESWCGALVIAQQDTGEIAIGILERNHDHDFYITLGERTFFLTQRRGREHTGATIAIIKQRTPRSRRRTGMTADVTFAQ